MNQHLWPHPKTEQPHIEQMDLDSQPPKVGPFAQNKPMPGPPKATSARNPIMNNPRQQPMTASNPTKQSSPEVPQMNDDENEVYNYFVDMNNAYNSAYSDETKRRDFGKKTQALLHKLENHEIKPDLLSLLKEFIQVNEYSSNKANEFKKLQWKIQSHDWDKNKSWMPLLGRLINMRKISNK